MDSLNPMFHSKGKNRSAQVRSSNVRDKTQNKRKVRSDKKYDVKIPLTHEDRVLVRMLAERQDMYPTNLCTALVRKGLSIGMEYGEFSYPSGSKVSFHAKLPKEDYEKLKYCSIKWDCSIKRAAHKILKAMLDYERRSML